MDKLFDVAIVGGSNAGLSAALILGRCLRQVVVFDAGKSRNKTAQHAHDFLTRDGEKPATILKIARQQLKLYKNVSLLKKGVTAIEKREKTFALLTEDNTTYQARRVILATGLTDVIPVIPGLKKVWGKKAIHCPYCHGWEFKNKVTGIVCNTENMVSKAINISNWSEELIFFTNAKCEVDPKTRKVIEKRFVIYEEEMAKVKETLGGLEVVLSNQEKVKVNALYVPTNYQYNNKLAVQLGCKLQLEGAVKVDENYETTVPGVFSAGDLVSQKLHHIVLAAVSGTIAGEVCNIQLNKEDF